MTIVHTKLDLTETELELLYSALCYRVSPDAPLTLKLRDAITEARKLSNALAQKRTTT
jgi:hypothetical protein